MLPVGRNSLYRCIEFMGKSGADLFEGIHQANDFAYQWCHLPSQRYGTSTIELSHPFSYIISVFNREGGVFVVFLDHRRIIRNVGM